MWEKAPAALAWPEPDISSPTYPADASEVKSLDLLAALPTPPHNQTEDVRCGRGRDGDEELGWGISSSFFLVFSCDQWQISHRAVTSTNL